VCVSWPVTYSECVSAGHLQADILLLSVCLLAICTHVASEYVSAVHLQTSCLCMCVCWQFTGILPLNLCLRLLAIDTHFASECVPPCNSICRLHSIVPIVTDGSTAAGGLQGLACSPLRTGVVSVRNVLHWRGDLCNGLQCCVSSCVPHNMMK